tara:strand:- start:709 stop:1182 length:474 start_codon:yes stop_codon:yes gene_type:complete
MKYLLSLILIISLIFSACKKDTNQKQVKISTEKNYDWLLGNWKRVSEDSIKQTFETWTKTGNIYNGHGYILEQNDTVWQERIVLKDLNNSWQLTVKTPGQNDAISFKETRFNDTLFTVENPKHDFPKKIMYWKENNLLKAEVSSEEATITFDFEKIK